jgi:hypothetical protein
MSTLICLVLAAALSGCLPIGIRGTSMPLRGAGEQPIVAAIDGHARPNEFGPTQSRFPDTSTAGALRDKRQVTQATHEHRRDPRKQESTDLQAGIVVHTAKTHDDGNCA